MTHGDLRDGKILMSLEILTCGEGDSGYWTCSLVGFSRLLAWFIMKKGIEIPLWMLSLTAGGKIVQVGCLVPPLTSSELSSRVNILHS